MNSKNLYSFLGISSDSTDEEIKKAYRVLTRKYHFVKIENNPNLTEEQKQEARDTFFEIQKAYQILGDKELRRKYDTKGIQGVEMELELRKVKGNYNLEANPEDYRKIFGERQLVMGKTPQLVTVRVEASTLDICKGDISQVVKVPLDNGAVAEEVITFPKGSTNNSLIVYQNKGAKSPLSGNRYMLIGILRLKPSSVFDLEDNLNVRLKKIIPVEKTEEGELVAYYTFLNQHHKVKINKKDLGKEVTLKGKGVSNEVTKQTGDLILKLSKTVS